MPKVEADAVVNKAAPKKKKVAKEVVAEVQADAVQADAVQADAVQVADVVALPSQKKKGTEKPKAVVIKAVTPEPELEEEDNPPVADEDEDDDDEMDVEPLEYKGKMYYVNAKQIVYSDDSDIIGTWDGENINFN